MFDLDGICGCCGNLPRPVPENMLKVMRALRLLIALPLLSSIGFSQAATKIPGFDVASVKPSQHPVGPDYNNQLRYSPAGIIARNVTLKRLVAEAYSLQVNQVLGPGWLDRNEYDIDAKPAVTSSREQITLMLRSLLAERFNLREHSETREMRVYELVIDKTGSKIHPAKEGETVKQSAGFHFHGDLRQFADLLAVQFSIPAPMSPNEPARAGGPLVPVLDKTRLPGIYDFSVNIRPELGTDMFTLWQRALRDQLGLGVESRKSSVTVVVVDEATRMPTEN
ncbi:MAG TPA: TIGR03435 family protein [Terracidiphilus sp.]|nr:TIGR03435 family protein [Terracidiphilus sp.]